MTRSIERQGQQWPFRTAGLIAAADQAHAALLSRLASERPIRVRLAMPKPVNLQLSQDQPDYSGSHGMKVYQDEQGDWSFKQPKPSLAFTVPLEAAAATLQRQMGLEAPESYVIEHNGAPAVVSKWYPGSHQAFAHPPHLDELSPDDQMTIQKNHVLDWLIGNHDSHVGNWMRTQDGKLVSIDKGQAGKYFGHDRLDPHFHPNYYAREPIYNQLYRDHASGRGQLHDPRTGELGAFVRQVQGIPDEHLKAMFRPYAQSAAKSGLLLSPDGDPSRELGPRTVPANDPEAFLAALVDRKNNLHRDLGDYHDRMSGGRERIGRSTGPGRQGPNPRFRPMNRPYYEQRVPIGLHQGDGGEVAEDDDRDPFDPRSFTAAGKGRPPSIPYEQAPNPIPLEQFGPEPDGSTLYSQSDIAAHLGMSPNGIKGLLKARRHPAPTYLTPSGVPMWHDLRHWDYWRANGGDSPHQDPPRGTIYSAREVARQLGVSDAFVRNHLAKSREMPPPTHIGSQGSEARLMWDDLRPWHDWLANRDMDFRSMGRPRNDGQLSPAQGGALPVLPSSEPPQWNGFPPPVRREPRPAQPPPEPPEDDSDLGEPDYTKLRFQPGAPPPPHNAYSTEYESDDDLLRSLHSPSRPGEGGEFRPRRAQRRRR